MRKFELTLFTKNFAQFNPFLKDNITILLK